MSMIIEEGQIIHDQWYRSWVFVHQIEA